MAPMNRVICVSRNGRLADDGRWPGVLVRLRVVWRAWRLERKNPPKRAPRGEYAANTDPCRLKEDRNAPVAPWIPLLGYWMGRGTG